MSVFNVCSPLLWVLCIGKWGFYRFMAAPVGTGSVTRTVQASGVINLIKELHMDVRIHRQETREWWEYFTACLSFNLSRCRGGMKMTEEGQRGAWCSLEVGWDSSAFCNCNARRVEKTGRNRTQIPGKSANPFDLRTESVSFLLQFSKHSRKTLNNGLVKIHRWAEITLPWWVWFQIQCHWH